MTKNKELDFTLEILINLNVDNKLVNVLDFPTSEKFDIPEIEDALSKLVLLGYAGYNSDSFGYWATFDGRKFYEETPNIFYKNQPFKYLNFKSKIAIYWTFIKTVGLITNSLAILYLMYLSIEVTNKTTKLEIENFEIKSQLIKKTMTIDSLNLELKKTKVIVLPQKKGNASGIPKS